MLTNGNLKDFREKELTSETKIYGNIAQRFVLSEKSGKLNEKSFEIRGMKTTQFTKVNRKWMTSSISWSDENN